jgi:hypothetical protein
MPKTKKLLRLDMSEELYLGIITFVFISLSVLLGIEIWVFNNALIEYSLGVGIFTSSIFLVLTIIFLSYLFRIREIREWNRVKSVVYFRINKIAEKIETNMIHNFVLYEFKGGFTDKRFRMSDTFLNFPEELIEYCSSLSSLSKEITSITDTYFKVLQPEMIEKLSILNIYLSLLQEVVQLSKDWSEKGFNSKEKALERFNRTEILAEIMNANYWIEYITEEYRLSWLNNKIH